MDLFLHIVLVLCLVSTGASLLTYVFFWYENGADFRCTGPDKPAGIAGSSLLKGILSGILSTLLVFALFPLGFFSKLRNPQKISSSQAVIVLIHGLYHNASAWTVCRRALKTAGFNNIFAFQYRSFFTSFEQTLALLEVYLERLHAEFPDQAFSLVGHSLGGLLARVYAEKHPDRAVAAVITLGTPHRGSKMAVFGPGRLAASLMFRGPLFEQLERSPNRLPCKGLALYSPVDNLVIPAEGLKVPYTGWLSRETHPMSHVAMLFAPSVIREVVEFIKTATSPDRKSLASRSH